MATKHWTKSSQAQLNLEALLKEGIITPDMGSTQVKKIQDPRIVELIKHSDSTLNRHISASVKSLGK